MDACIPPMRPPFGFCSRQFPVVQTTWTRKWPVYSSTSVAELSPSSRVAGDLCPLYLSEIWQGPTLACSPRERECHTDSYIYVRISMIITLSACARDKAIDFVCRLSQTVYLSSVCLLSSWKTPRSPHVAIWVTNKYMYNETVKYCIFIGHAYQLQGHVCFLLMQTIVQRTIDRDIFAGKMFRS